VPAPIIPRKIDLTEQQHKVCDAVKKLRLSLGLSQAVFARQLGTNQRGVLRWEHHDYCPRSHFLRRLDQLQKLNARLGEEEKRQMKWLGQDEPKTMRRVKGKERLRAVNGLAILLVTAEIAVRNEGQDKRRRRLHLQIQRESIDALRGGTILAKLDEKTGVYRFNVKRPQAPRRAKKGVTE